METPSTHFRPAAQYLRMSTDQQTFSLEHQAASNAAYALASGYEIVRTYSDAGVSGLRIDGREGLKQLLADVMGGSPGYETVLVYDVSRWGRFQDPDQSGHYEFLCREAGVNVEYCAETFANDGSLASSLIKQIKRAMAAEYSRELSVKVSQAQRRLFAKGFWQGGPPGYGLRRQAVDPTGESQGVLEYGQHNAIRGRRIRLVLGPAEEVETVRRIFRLFVISGTSLAALSKLLNAEGILAEGGTRWTPRRVRQLLQDEKYLGTLVSGKQVTLLKRTTLRRRVDWVRRPNTLEPLMSADMFGAARRNLRTHKPKVSDDELLDELRQVLAQEGTLSRGLIDAHPATHSISVYRRQFGSLMEAYARIGYQPTIRQLQAVAIAKLHKPHRHQRPPIVPNKDELLEQLRALLAAEGTLSVSIINSVQGGPRAEVIRTVFGGMRRAYALVGYEPSAYQERAMDRNGGQTISRAEAGRIRRGEVQEQI